MSGRRSRSKGARRERQVVDLHRKQNIGAERIPLSGACEGFKGDVRIRPGGSCELRGEVKARANGEGFTTIKRWLGDNDVLFLVEDRCAPLAVLPWSTYSKLLEAARQVLAIREGDRSDATAPDSDA